MMGSGGLGVMLWLEERLKLGVEKGWTYLFPRKYMELWREVGQQTRVGDA